MKKKLKMTSIFLSLIAIWQIAFPLSAKSPQATVSPNLTGRELEILEELTNLDPTYDDVDGEIVSAEKVTITREEIESSTDESSLKRVDIEPYGGIKSTYMTMYTTVTRVLDSGYDKFLLYAYFKWEKFPFMQLTDGIALAWSDNFTLLSSSMNLYYEGPAANAYHNDRAYLSGTTPESGVGYAFPIVHVQSSEIYDTLRWGSIRAYVRKYDSSGSANVVAKYVHKTLGIGPSFSFSSSGPSISVSVNGTYDSREVYNSWEY